MTIRCQDYGISTKVNPTRLEEAVLEHFPDLTEEKGTRNRVFLICSKFARKIISDAARTPEEESRALLLAASVLRKAVANHDTCFKFAGSFPKHCQESSIPPQVMYFFRHLLGGPKSAQGDDNNKNVLYVSQIAMFNMILLPNSMKVEPPLSVYVTLNLHSQTRSKKLIDFLHAYCICVSYKTVLAIEAGAACSIAEQAGIDKGVVCPSNLCKNVFTVAALDNLDHNPTSRTAASSFHGTGISIFQISVPGNPGIGRDPATFQYGSKTIATGQSLLPDSYTVVPPVDRNLCGQPIHKIKDHTGPCVVDVERNHEESWMNSVHENLYNNSIGKEDNKPLMWSAYHASQIDSAGSTAMKCISALLPFFHEKSASPEMILHGMKLVGKTIQFLNPDQIPVLVVDQPLYALAKKLQWTYPESLGEEKICCTIRWLTHRDGIVGDHGRPPSRLWLDRSANRNRTNHV